MSKGGSKSGKQSFTREIMEQETRKLKFCKAAVVLLTYGVLNVLTNVKILPYLRWFDILLLCLPIVYGGVLFAKNKTANIVVWVLAVIMPCLLNIASTVHTLFFENIPYGIDYINFNRIEIMMLVRNCLSLPVGIVLVAATVKMGKENFRWKAAKIYVAVVQSLAIIELILQNTSFVRGDGFSIFNTEILDSIQIFPVIAQIVWQIALIVIYLIGILLYINWAEKPYTEGIVKPAES